MELDFKMFNVACEEWLKCKRGEDEILNAVRETNPDAVTMLLTNKKTGETFCYLCSSKSDAESYEKSDKNIRNVGKIFERVLELQREGDIRSATAMDVYRAYLSQCTLEKLLHADERDKGGK